LLVFEVRGAIGAFADAVRRVPGLELIDEEELKTDEGDQSPVAYLMVPDTRALQNLERLWRRWLRNQLVQGETPWRDVFALLRDLRPWGPQDRVQPSDSGVLGEEVAGRSRDETVRLEIELVYRADPQVGADRDEEVRRAVQAQSGKVVARSRIDDIAYHALLVLLSHKAALATSQRTPSQIDR